MCFCVVFFFFSSRRRHTRFDCDWSSDVCSSDLFAVLFIIGLALAFLRWRTKSLWPSIFLHFLNNGLGALLIRSEEHTSELQSQSNLVCRLLLEKKKKYPLHSRDVTAVMSNLEDS